MRLARSLECVLAGILLAAALFSGGSALAQQTAPAQKQVEPPHNNAATWREVRREGQEHYTSVRGRETGVLVQTLGETWRSLRNGWIIPAAGWLIVAIACGIALLHRRRGPIRLQAKRTGRLIQRFTPVDRVAHWTVAISFCVLGVSGLIMMFGKHVLLPVIGYTLFSWLTQLAKHLHNFIGPVFIAGISLLIVLFAKYAWPRAGDLNWFIKNAGGLLTGSHVPAGKLHAGQKLWFWGGVVVMSVVVAVSGLVMDFPNFDQTRSTMILANVVHSSVAGLLTALALFHIYMGSKIGLEGAYEGMRYGYVDEAWAKEHHELWYQDVKAGRTSAPRAEGTPESPQVTSGA